MAENNNEGAKVKFLDGVKAEFHKISWPASADLGRQTTAVIIISVILGGFIALIDMAFQYGFNWITTLGL